MLINHASADPRFRDHPGLHLYGIESYIAVPLLRRDGSLFGTLCALDPLPSKVSEEAFALFQLLSELIAYELEEDERNRQREAEVDALEDFFAIAAHDLKQPLTALSARAQLLSRRVRKGVDAHILADTIDSLVADVRRVTQLSDSLLDIAQIERNLLVVDKGPTDLIALARTVLRDVQSVAPGHDFRLNAPLALHVLLDERRIGQVLRNLLDNASKYAASDTGPIELTIDPFDPSVESAGIRLSVRDHGPGVPPDEMADLFTRRFRSSTARASHVTGSGLGLFIAREIINAHGGAISACLPHDGGLLVRITLPTTTD